MRRSQLVGLLIIGVLFAVSVWSVAVPRWRIAFFDSEFERGNQDAPLGLRLGLDLQGGVHLVYETVEANPTADELEGTIQVIRRRVDAFGVAEPLIQALGDNRVLIQLPGVNDPEAAKELIGAPAVLDFRELVVTTVPREQATPTAESTPSPEATPAADATPAPEASPTPLPVDIRADWNIASAQVDGREILLTGERLVPGSAQVAFDPTTGQPEVLLRFDRDGGEAFRLITRRLVQFDSQDPRRQLGIFLDGEPISTPEVLQEIPAGEGRITGLNLVEARLLAIQLNAGAFPTPLKKEPVFERAVDPFLGRGALDQSFKAGLVGLGLIALFLVMYYRLSGLTAALALVVYGALALAIFKTIPVVLTVAGLAAFALSIGMAIDANVLIFERMKEEIRAGRGLGSAVDIGFSRAWNAIRDSNLTTLIAAAILFWFADRLGASVVQGFALTLIIGVALSMFTALVVTRSFLQVFVRTPLARRVRFFSP